MEPAPLRWVGLGTCGLETALLGLLDLVLVLEHMVENLPL